MKLKRGIALLLAAVFLFGTLAVPAGAAASLVGSEMCIRDRRRHRPWMQKKMISSRCASRHPVS